MTRVASHVSSLPEVVKSSILNSPKHGDKVTGEWNKSLVSNESVKSVLIGCDVFELHDHILKFTVRQIDNLIEKEKKSNAKFQVLKRNRFTNLSLPILTRLSKSANPQFFCNQPNKRGILTLAYLNHC